MLDDERRFLIALAFPALDESIVSRSSSRTRRFSERSFIFVTALNRAPYRKDSSFRRDATELLYRFLDPEGIRTEVQRNLQFAVVGPDPDDLLSQVLIDELVSDIASADRSGFAGLPGAIDVFEFGKHGPVEDNTVGDRKFIFGHELDRARLVVF